MSGILEHSMNERSLDIKRVIGRDLRGNSSPVIAETAEGRFLVKLRGAAHGTAALVAEVVTGGIADLLGLEVPERRLLRLESGTPSNDLNDELADLLAASTGENLGFRFLEEARVVDENRLASVDPDWAVRVRWLDWLVMNPDRSPVNPNILEAEGRLWLIDHGSALPFHHDWSKVTAATPTEPELPVPHIFDDLIDLLPEIDRELTSLLSRDALEVLLAGVPASFLRPLLADELYDIDMLRAAYVKVLVARLEGERRFRKEEVPQRDSGPVPGWVL